METTQIFIEAEHNSRVVSGLMANEDKWSTDEGFAVFPRNNFKDYIIAWLDVDLGRYDGEGDAYILELLNILPGDLCYSDLSA